MLNLGLHLCLTHWKQNLHKQLYLRFQSTSLLEVDISIQQYKEQLLKQTHIEQEKFEHLIKEIEEGITDAEGMLDKTARKEIASLTKYYIKKIRTKDHVDGGISYKEKKKLLDALDKYEKLVVDGMKPLTAKNKVRRLKKFDWSLGTLKKYLTKARKLRQQP